MSNVKARQLLYNSVKPTLELIVSLSLFATLLVLAIVTLYRTYGGTNQSVLQPSDVYALTNNENKENEKPSTTSVTTKPIRLLLPSVNLGIDILDSTIVKESNEWPLSDDSVHYANFTPGLGSETGTLVLYGHRTWAVLRKAKDLQINDSLVLLDENNKKWEFKLTKSENVTPDKVGFIYENVPFRVVLFTCDGWNDKYRKLMYFEPA